MKKNYYKILGISKTASKDEIRRSYFSLAKKWHPDISKENNSENKFKEISEAYEILSDSLKKSNYTKNIEYDKNLYKNRNIYYGIFYFELPLEEPMKVKFGIDKWLELLFDRIIRENSIISFFN